VHKIETLVEVFLKNYSGVRIFNSLPCSLTILKNKRAKFKVALERYLNTHSLYAVDEFLICTDDLYIDL
jgi:hypothetical protein